MRSWPAPDVPRLPVTGPPVRVHDTATGELVTTDPDGPARFYVCGITPYDATHLGHANTYLSFDLLVRAWLDAGREVSYTQNVTAMQVLLERLAAQEVSRLVFSSSAATFGTPDVDLVTETTPTRPESPYGESKLIGEWLIRDVARVSALTHTSLRYFNVVGSGYADLYDSSPHNLFPLVLKALTEGRTPSVNGTDYPTPDGSCVRDYVHVDDLALAHVAAAEALEAGRSLEPVYNLGSGEGSSVIQIMDAVRRVTGIEFTPERRDRRPGDPARIVATGELAIIVRTRNILDGRNALDPTRWREAGWTYRALGRPRAAARPRALWSGDWAGDWAGGGRATGVA